MSDTDKQIEEAFTAAWIASGRGPQPRLDGYDYALFKAGWRAAMEHSQPMNHNCDEYFEEYGDGWRCTLCGNG